MQIVNVLGFKLPQYKSPTLLLSLGLSVRVFWHLIMTRPDVIHVSSPGLLVFAGILYAKLLDLPLVVSYHTHVPGEPMPAHRKSHRQGHAMQGASFVGFSCDTCGMRSAGRNAGAHLCCPTLVVQRHSIIGQLLMLTLPCNCCW